MSAWHEKHILKVKGNREFQELDAPDSKKLRTEIEPWLTALSQSEHFSLLLGSGLSSAVHYLAKGEFGADMGKIKFTVFAEQMEGFVKATASKLGRGDGNIEDQIRVANDCHVV